MSVRHFFRRAPTASAQDAVRLISEGALVVDVRGEREFLHHHIPGAWHIPLAELEARAIELPEDRLLITFCTGGLLSSNAANLLKELGFVAASLAGGIISWRAAGGQLEGGSER